MLRECFLSDQKKIDYLLENTCFESVFQRRAENLDLLVDLQNPSEPCLSVLGYHDDQCYGKISE